MSEVKITEFTNKDMHSQAGAWEREKLEMEMV